MTAYVDPVAVERACWGDRVYLRPKERTAAAQRLTARGLSAQQIADMLGVSSRTIRRCRARKRIDVSAF